jgi:hypothetical protein
MKRKEKWGGGMVKTMEEESYVENCNLRVISSYMQEAKIKAKKCLRHSYRHADKYFRKYI